jgi:dihydrofolate reductase
MNTEKKLSIIAAVAQNGAIGKDNDLLWHISADLKRFKQLTLEHTVVMGKNTYYSLPIRPFPKRRNVVITSNRNAEFEGCETASSIEEAIALCRQGEETFIIGGSRIYEQFLPLVDKLYITWVYKDFEADCFFPNIDPTIFKQTSISERMHDEKSGLDYAYCEYERCDNKE